VAPLGCSAPSSTSSPASATDGDSASISLNLDLAPGVVLSSVSYTITGPSGFTKTGSVDVSNSGTLSFLVGGIPAGNGYSITTSATSTDGSVSCAGSASFNVAARMTTTVAVHLACHETARVGSVQVNGVLNICPVIDDTSANPSEVMVGSTIQLTGAAHDTDSGPAALSYSWTASSGFFDNAKSASPVFSCTAPGAATLSLTVSDGDPSATCADHTTITVNCDDQFLTTKTPYLPQQDATSYEPPPAGYSVVYTELVSRHGSRGLSSVKYDAATLNMWQQAATDGALTPLGQELGPDVTAIMKANAFLGVGVPGIQTPGYGNLTQIGIREQKQLALRFLARLPSYFAGVASASGGANQRTIPIVSSGMDRAVDSAAFFAGSIASANPTLGALVIKTPPLTAYPSNAPVAQLPGVNKYLLYFHKLTAKTDLVTNPSDPFFQTYQDSLAFQAYASDATMNAKVNAILADPSAVAAARTTLEALFTPDFVNKIDQKIYTFSNAGTFTFTSDDGTTSATVTGDGKTKVQSLTDAASMLYNLYAIAPAMVNEAHVDFDKYIAPAQAQEFAFLQDAQDFYEMGPGIQEANPVTYKMAQALQDDFFHEVDQIAAGDLSHAAKLRFTHAEIICPFASILGLKNVFVPMPAAQTYSYATNPWRGELVAPLAANVQWDVASDGKGSLLVKMLYNERETDFKAACDTAKVAPASHYYDYAKLHACYYGQ
jgi:hypothetical protein